MGAITTLQNHRRTPIEISWAYNEVSGKQVDQIRTGSRTTHAREISGKQPNKVEEENNATIEETEADAENDAE